MKRFLSTTFGWLFIINFIFAQEFQLLRSEDYPISEELPIYTEQVKLGYGISENDVRVIVEYPEFEVLSKQEKKLLKKYNHILPDTISVLKQFGIEKKCGILEVGVLPFININGVPHRIKNFNIRIKSNNIVQYSNALHNNQVNRYANSSVLANGAWVKIKVEKEGVYQLNDKLIKSWGFSDLKKIKVYGHGGRIQDQILQYTNEYTPIDDLKEVATYRDDNKILFFAEGTIRYTWNKSKLQWEHENNYYSTSSYYFITEGDNPNIMETLPAEIGGEIVNVVKYPTVYDEDAYSWYEGGRQFYDSYNFANGNSKTYTLNTTSATTGQATINVSFSASSFSGSTTLEIACNNQTSRQNIRACGSNESAVDIKRTLQVKDLSEKTSIKFTTTAQRNARLNYFLIAYPRLLSAADEPFAFVPTPDKNNSITLSVNNATSTTELWRIKADNTISKMGAKYENDQLIVPIDYPKDRYVIVNTEQNYPNPTLVGKINNQNLHADENIDMIVIVPESGIFDKEAQRLIEAHTKYNNLRSKIVHQDQIFNEFGSGTPDATAIRRYVKMLYDKANSDEDLPKYLLFFGNCTFDNRMITEQNKKFSTRDFLLSYEENDNYRTSQITSVGDLLSYPTDDYFGLLDDGEGNSVKTEKVDIAIGRFVCGSEKQAKILVDKSINYLENNSVGSWKNQIVCIGDAKDKNAHMEDTERVIQTINNATDNTFNIKRIYPDLYTRTVTNVGYRFPKAKEILKESIKQGALIFNYSGHGSPAQISHAYIFAADEWSTVKSSALPLWILASCEILPYDQNTSDFARQALFHENGGAVAFMCASRAVYASENNHLNIAYCDYLLKQNADGSYNTMGEALRLAKNQLITLGKDRTINKLKYILAGDPALPLMRPKRDIQLDSINGIALTNNKKVQLKAGSIARFSGSILENFNGVITAKIYDKTDVLTCKNNDGSADTAFVYRERTKIIFEGSDSVINGKFILNIPIPKDISYSNENGRISLYAISNDHKVELHGFNENFYLNGTENANTENIDSIGPKAFIYLNDPEFPNGGLTHKGPIFIAILNDSSGINASGITVGHDIELQLDNDPNKIFVLNDYFSYNFGSFQNGRIEYQLTDVSPGEHNIQFRVWDLNNNATTQSLRFKVADIDPSHQQIYATNNPASNSTQFVAIVNNEHLGGTITFEVYSVLGKLLWNKTNNIFSTTITQNWNLCTNNSIPLPKGMYLYRAILNSPVGKEEMKTQRIIIK